MVEWRQRFWTRQSTGTRVDRGGRKRRRKGCAEEARAEGFGQVTRILIDTNVYVPAVIFGGKPALVLQLAELPGIELAVSAELDAEFPETLAGKFG
jgi:hypothetical protein